MPINGILQKNEIKHNSKQVTDIKTEVLPYIEKISEMCKIKVGRHSGGVAIAHCQVEKDNPLTFFVFADGECVVNPKILMKRESFMHLEGCLSLAYRPEKKVKRYREINVSYISVIDSEIIEYSSLIETGLRACVFQHEIDHFKRIYV